MIRTLSFVVTESSRDAPALAAAEAIALREDAHLDVICLGVEPIPVDAIAMKMPPMAMEWNAAQARERAEALANWVRPTLPTGLLVTVQPVTAPGLSLAAVAAQVGRFSDLAVIVRPYGPDVGELAPILAEGLLFSAGVPVLVVPDHDRTDWSRPFRRLCLAWNDGDEALHAARAALPFLQAAEQVDIAIITPPVHAYDGTDPGHDLSLWLARHGVKAEVVILAKTEPQVADILTRFCRERGCEALVMGAYGHSCLREALLGGITRAMLANAPLPLIMAH